MVFRNGKDVQEHKKRHAARIPLYGIEGNARMKTRDINHTGKRAFGRSDLRSYLGRILQIILRVCAV